MILLKVEAVYPPLEYRKMVDIFPRKHQMFAVI